MPRPRLSLLQRFADIHPIWAQAERLGGITFDVNDEAAAVNIVYRLNQYRKHLRGTTETDYTSLDSYVVRRHNSVIQIAPRPVYDISNMRTLDGRPITPMTPEAKPSPFDEIARKQLAGENDGSLTPQEQAIKDQVAMELRKFNLKLE